MLNDVLPLVSTLHIVDPSQLRLGLVTQHFRDVRSVNIYKLFRKRYSLESSLEFAQRSPNKVVHFLCRFPLLKTVYFWGEIGSDSTLGDRNVCSLVALGNTYIRTDHDERTMNHLFDAISGAFDFGALSNSVSIIGLSCPRRLTQQELRECVTFARAYANISPFGILVMLICAMMLPVGN